MWKSGSNEAFSEWQLAAGVLQKYSKDWKESYLDIQARHSRALSRTQASVKCVSHKCLLHWAQCVFIGVYSKSVCACKCVEMLFMGQGDLYWVQWALSLAEGEPLYRHAQPNPAPGPGWAREYRWNAGPDWRPAQAPHTFLSKPLTPHTSFRFIWEWVVGHVAIIHSLYFIFIFYDGGWMQRKKRQTFTGACWKFMSVLATKQILAAVLCSTCRKVDLKIIFQLWALRWVCNINEMWAIKCRWLPWLKQRSS